MSGQKKGEKKGSGSALKHKVLSLVDRNTSREHSMVVDSLKATDLTPILVENIAAEAHIMTDEAGQYAHLSKTFQAHDFVRLGAGEYGRGAIHTNTIEGYFSIFKRGMKGVYQNCGEKRLHCYLAEFDFRYNNRSALGVEDVERSANVLTGIKGKRLQYRSACAWP